jgi:putative endonuclease
LIGALRRLFGIAGAAEMENTPAAWEERAARFLEGKGFRTIARNSRQRRGEIDIVADDKGTIVFVEVKARRSREFGGPEYAIDRKKRRRLLQAAKEFIIRGKLSERPCRFDAVLIYTGGQTPEFQHITDAFGDDGP